VRTYRSKARLICPEAGAVAGGRFGRYEGNGRFTPLPIEASGSCADLTNEPLALAVNIVPGRGERGPRVVVFGAVSGRVRALTLTEGTSSQPIAIGDDSTFIVVRAGTSSSGLVVHADLDGGASRDYVLSPPSGK
jgi:hypothetical protein